MYIIRNIKRLSVIATCMLLLSQGIPAQAQFFSDLFNQQSKKRRLMAEQIASYQIYLGAIRSGYNIAKKGWSTANGLKNGTFSLHDAYFNSLEQVSPSVKSSPKGRAIDSLYRQTGSLFANEKQWQLKHKLLTLNEQRHLVRVSDALLAKVKLDRDELEELMTPGKLQLTDAERLTRLDNIYARVKDKYAFAGHFTAQCRKLALQREVHQKDKARMKELYGIQ